MKEPVRIDRLSDQHLRDLTELFAAAWWAQGRTLDEVCSLFEHDQVFVAYADGETDHLIAFARTITDFTFKAFVLDVIVAEHYRNRGLGSLVMEKLLEHPALQKVRCIDLHCLPELIPFYHKHGFEEVPGDIRILRKNVF